MSRIIGIPLALIALLIVPVGPGLAQDGPTPAERAAVLQPDDLTRTEVTLGTFAFKAGGAQPVIYLESNGDVAATGTRSSRAVIQRASSGLVPWQSGTYIYASSSAAADSFARLKASAMRVSRPLVHRVELDEGFELSMILGDVPVLLKDKAGMSRFAVDSFAVGRSAGVDLDELDRYSYTVTYRAGRTVVMLGVQSFMPLTPDELEEIRDATLAVAQRARMIR